MASYVYNPSQKITELLSQYLEFDPKQLEIGIWSGDLSLKNVQLREEAIYPLLNGLHPGDKSPEASSVNESIFNTTQQSKQQQDYVQPPLKFKLISGKIGSLSMKIPWKSLVWGQGDVVVDLRNVVLILALESRDETDAREARARGDDASRHVAIRLFPEIETQFDSKPDPDPLKIYTTRERKQRILREAEKRRSENRAIAPWLRAIQEKDRQRKTNAVSASTTATLTQKEGHIDRWLRSTTKDFFWRFLAGLQLNIENLKIVLVQDKIEVGVIMPSNKMLAGVQQNKNSGNRKDSKRIPINTDLTESGASGSYTSAITPPKTMVYEGEYEDGEHIDKQVRVVGIGFFIRAVSNRMRNPDHMHYPIDVSTNDFILRPVDIDFRFSLFFPYPPDKRQKRKTTDVASQQKQSLNGQKEDKSVVSDFDDGTSIMNYTTDSSFRRRGKREKRPIEDTNNANETVEQTNTTMINVRNSPTVTRLELSKSLGAKHLRALPDLDVAPKRGTFQRQQRPSSYVVPVTVNGSTNDSSSTTAMSTILAESLLPLAQPDDIQSQFAFATHQAIRNNDLVPRFDARLIIGGVHVVCSTNHYDLINCFLASGAKLRNGRPTVAIEMILKSKNRNLYGTNRRLSIAASVETLSMETHGESSGRLGSSDDVAIITKLDVVNSWWRYVLGTVVWEIRQRKKLRKLFQTKFLSFSWSKLRYRRKEYVDLFINFRLKNNNTRLQPWTDPERQLLEIEDDLCIEQILLYRWIARRLYVYGINEMPDSLTMLHAHEQNVKASAADPSYDGLEYDTDDGIPSKRDSLLGPSRTNEKEDEGFPSFITMIEECCEVVRKRSNHENGEKLSSLVPYMHRMRIKGPDGSVIGIDDGLSANQTIRTFKTSRSNFTGVTSFRDSFSAQEPASTSMVISFSVSIAELEFIMTEDGGDLPSAYSDLQEGPEVRISGAFGSADVSVVSDLTYDWDNDSNRSEILHDDDDDTEPIIASTDFLLFKTPKKIILQIVVKLLNCSALGRSSGSRNLNLSVGQVAVSGEGRINLLTIGEASSDQVPVNEIQVSREKLANSQREKSLTQNNPRDALSLSLIDKLDDNFLQCDISRLQGCIHYQSIAKILDFVAHTSVHFPKPLMQKSAKEAIRLYVLQQNSRPPFTAINCSLRIHGCELSFPVLRNGNNHSDMENDEESIESKKSNLAIGSVVRCGIIEIYSGSVVESLRCLKSEFEIMDVAGSRATRRKSVTHKKIDTRQLRLLDVAELLENRSSLSSYHWVLAITENDCYMYDRQNEPLSFFENPVDIEVLLTVNTNSVIEYHRAKTDIIAEMSPIHVLVSGERFRRLSQVLPPHVEGSPRSTAPSTSMKQLPPRLEILSRFVRFSFELAISMVRVSLLSIEEREASTSALSKRLLMEEIMKDFLNVVRSFDLVFPHEEALSASMQICIDRLSGLGLPLHDAWDATNKVMLNFLEDMAEAKATEDESDFQFLQQTPSEQTTRDKKNETSVVRKIIEDSIVRTISHYVDLLQESQVGAHHENVDVVIDIPDGLAVSVVDLFFDQHVRLGLSTMFLVDGNGVHVVRLHPHEEPAVSDEVESASNLSEKVETSESEKKVQDSALALGVIFHLFKVDKYYGFGRGGLPLAALGTDSASSEEAEKRERQSFYDIELGDLDIYFSQGAAAKIIHSLVRLFNPLNAFHTEPEKTLDSESNSDLAETSLLVSCASLSTLFLADTLFPFCRLNFMNVITRIDPNPARLVFRLSSQSIDLLNLTPEGELHPTVVTVRPEEIISPLLCLATNDDHGSNIQIDFKGIRICFLMQFLNEFLQYFASGHYGLSLLLKQMHQENQVHKGNRTEETTGKRINLRFIDSTLIMPRSTASCDIVAIHLDLANVVIGSGSERFQMPSESSTLYAPGISATASGNSSSKEVGFTIPRMLGDSNEGQEGLVRRTFVELLGCRILSSLVKKTKPDRTVENPSFRYFYAIDGKPVNGNRVYRSISVPDEGNIDNEISEDADISENIWREMTLNAVSMDVIVESIPEFRILISDRMSVASNTLSLDLRLSQFCLILSIWDSNMKELPLMFPFSAAELQARACVKVSDFPEYGTDAFKSKLHSLTMFSSEFGFHFNNMCLRLIFDDDIEDKEANFEEERGILLALEHATFHIRNEVEGSIRVGAGSSKASIIDQSKLIPSVLTTPETSLPQRAWADFLFGMSLSGDSLSEPLAQAFQLSIFMTQDCLLCNLGLNSPRINLSDFSTIFTGLRFFTVYYDDERYGNPSFETLSQVQLIKQELSTRAGIGFKSGTKKCSITDFRLWLAKPILKTPCDPLLMTGPGLRIGTESGLWYKYSSMGFVTSQEVVAERMYLVFEDDCSHQGKVGGSASEGRSLIKQLSFGFRLDSNVDANHTDVSVQIPLSSSDMCCIIAPRFSITPKILESPTICVPFKQPERYLGPDVCELTCVIDLLPQTSATLLSLFGVSTTIDTDSSQHSNQQETLESLWREKDAEMRFVQTGDSSSVKDVNGDNSTISVLACLQDLRIFALDPVLGPHLPVAVMSISYISVCLSQFAPKTSVVALIPGDAPPEDLQVSVEGQFFADYFKLGLTRSWEPLIEPYRFTALYEESRFRGTGLSLESDSSFHVNISSALLVILDEVVDVFGRLIRDTFSKTARTEKIFDNHFTSTVQGLDNPSIISSLDAARIEHKIPTPLKDGDRVAFSLSNMTGQKIRVFQEHQKLSESVATLLYLDHGQATTLSFRPSISVIKNLRAVEMPYPGIPNARENSHENIAPHTVDLQLPGFHWLKGIFVDTFGRSFAGVTPLSEEVATKTTRDWRLRNVMNVLIEVGMKNGGRQVTVRSLFSIVNKTTHNVCLVVNPDASFQPKDEHPFLQQRPIEKGNILNSSNCETLEPGHSFQIPTLLLESALCRSGNQLGCVWMRPFFDSSNFEALQSFLGESNENSNEVRIEFSSRPLSVSKLVRESSVAFDHTLGEDVAPENANTALQVSCPVFRKTGDRLAPFCYAIEIGRSPLVCDRHEDQRKCTQGNYIHGPVAYTISIFPPLVIANLLPQKGRFELMHAVRRTLLWFGDLEPGQQVSVHSVGLDAPVLLFLNLRFAKTPVGEGALIHHGADPPSGARDNLSGLKSIGKAGKLVRKHIGKTLTSIGESADQRGLHRLNKANNPRTLSVKFRTVPVVRGEGMTGFESDPDEEVADAKTYKVDAFVSLPNDVADETTVVDGIGQRLTLGIDNVRGGGGQRRVAVFAPYWIVNCTEHPLRYRQESSVTFVSGTVQSPDNDGSLPLSGGRTIPKLNEENTHNTAGWNSRKIFSGTFGALATSPGRCDYPTETIAKLIDRNLSLENLASLAFMFSFNEASVIAAASQKLCVQLGDGTGQTRYESDWSRGFSVDSVGISQIVAMHCKDGRALEVTMIVGVAPGPLSGYTKIVRFLPRYVIVNTLPYPVRIWQDSSVFRPVSADQTENLLSHTLNWRLRNTKKKKKQNAKTVNQYEALWGRTVVVDDGDSEQMMSGTTAHVSARYITTVSPSNVTPFILPDSSGDRQLRIDVGAPFKLTASFSADIPGEHTLKLEQAVDLKLVPHVSTRLSPQYEVRISPYSQGMSSAELGLWFETEWGANRSLIVKGIKKHSYAYYETDIHVGDELLSIDGILVSKMTFLDATSMIRSRLNTISTAVSLYQENSGSRRKLRRTSLNFVSKRFTEQKEDDNAAFDVRPVRLIFRTVEERLRRVRLKAARTSTLNSIVGSSIQTDAMVNRTRDESVVSLSGSFLNAELRTLRHSELSMFLVLRDKPTVPFLIQNRSLQSTVYYRQRGCFQDAWKSVKPGQTNEYAWDEPMKPKRLTIRVAWENGMQEYEDDQEMVFMEHENEIRKKRLRFGNLEDEEHAAFSSSLSVRLEEIGYRDYLAVPSHDTNIEGLRAGGRYLIAEVDVQNTTRVLTINDASKHDDESRMTRHMDVLEKRIDEEGNTLNKLRNLLAMVEIGELSNAVDASEMQTVVDEANQLMIDYSDETTISACHQIVVEVLEASGLCPESIIGVCNPYVELSLKAKLRRKSLFAKKDVRRTYYVRKTINPTWSGQVFVFEVPPEAASFTRGHSIQLCVRNYRSFRTRQSLGRAQIDLHFVRDQEPLIGWYPLAGRTGRRELENQLSHWGRGSIKVRIQWIYTVPALIRYYLLLSEGRLGDYLEKLKGVSLQLQKKRESDAKLKEGIDGFKAVRVYDLVADRRNVGFRDANSLDVRFVKNLIEPLTDKRRRENWHSPVKSQNPPTNLDSKGGRNISRTPMSARGRFDTLRELSASRLTKLEVQLSDKRGSLQEFVSRRALSDLQHSFQSTRQNECTISLKSFKVLTHLQEICKESEFELAWTEQLIRVSLARPSTSTDHEKDLQGSPCQQLIHQKLSLPIGSPSALRDQTQKYITAFIQSRCAFERAARRAIRTILNPGGWLTVRPITALNLPDTFSGMFVKVCYGSEIISSEMADAKVIPTWFKSEVSEENQSNESTFWADELLSDLSENNLHIYVAPQQTHGSIKISVIGERSHQKLNTRSELGVLHLPLGSAIAACIDCVDTHYNDTYKNNTASGLPAYVRWFPLMNPRDAVPIEGDGGLSIRPKESEKSSFNLFSDYFAPSLQLAFIWTPDAEDEPHSGDNSEVPEDLYSQHNLQSSSGYPLKLSNPLVQNYFNADIGSISWALIDSQRAVELLSCTVLDVDARYWVTKAKTRMGISVGWIQLDYQEDQIRERVIFAPTPTDFLLPVLQVLAVKDNIRSKTEVLTYDFIDVSVAEFDLTIEEILAFDLYSFLYSVNLRKGVNLQTNSMPRKMDTGSTNHDGSLTSELNASSEPTFLSLVIDELKDNVGKEKKVYIDQLFLGAVKVNLSYLKGRRVSWQLPTYGRWVDDTVDKVFKKAGNEFRATHLTKSREESDVFRSWSRFTSDDERRAEDGERGFKSIPVLLATVIPTLSDAPVRLQGKALNHVFESPTEILQSIREFYFKETLNQIYKIIGSLDFVGNPTMLVTSFLSGLSDLIRAPSLALVKSPTDAKQLGLGVAQGTLSLISHSVSGFFGVLAKVSAAAGQAVATLSLDSEFRDWHSNKVVIEATNLNREWKRRGVQSCGLMITRPVFDIALGIVGGVSGVVVAPLRGFQNGGTVGLLRGLAVGSIGLVAKPTVGILDSFSHFSASIFDIAKSVNVLDKRLQPALQLRLPYTFGMLTILEPFNAATARVAYLLKLYPVREGAQSSEIIVHVERLENFGKDTYAIATSCRVVLINVKKEVTGTLSPTLSWEVYLAKGSAVASRVSDHGHNGVALTITVSKETDEGHREKNPGQAYKSPSPAKASPVSARSMSLLTDEKIASIARNDFVQGTSRSDKGEMFEWFTILAEYQNRRQLTRLHNAISCIIGDFDAVIRDPWIGRPGSAEGYTSFGMYYFETDPEDRCANEFSDVDVKLNLDDAPWIPKSAFKMFSHLTIDEQEAYQSSLPENCCFEKQIEALKAEGGPVWMIYSLARALSMSGDAQPQLNTDSEHLFHSCVTPSLKPQKNHVVRSILKKLGRQGRQVSTQQYLEQRDGSFKVTDKRNPESDVSVESFESTFSNEIVDADDQPSAESGDEGNSIGRSNPSPYQISENSEYRPAGRPWVDSLLRPIAASAQTTSSFHSAVSRFRRSRKGQLNSTTTNLESSDDSLEGSIARPALKTDRDEFQVGTLVNVQESIPLQSGNIVSRPSDYSQGYPQTTSTQISYERMDRMEAVLERLLIFSSEQALHFNDTSRMFSSSFEEVSALRQQVKDLRSKIESAGQNDDESKHLTDKVVELNNEIASLREQLAEIKKQRST